MNFLERLRMGSIFDPNRMLGNDLPSQGGITGNMFDFGNQFENQTAPVPTPQPVPAVPAVPEPIQPIVTEMGGEIIPTEPGAPGMQGQSAIEQFRAFKPETAATEEFNRLVSSYPEYQRPGIWRTLAAIGSALGPGGHQTGQAVLNEPNLRRQAEWKAQISPVEQAAQLERQSNINTRTQLYQAAQQEMADARAREIERHNREMEETKAAGGWRQVRTEGGNAYLVNDKTGEIRQTDVAQGTMTRPERIEAETAADKELIRLRAEETRKTAEAKEAAKGQQKAGLEFVRSTASEALAELDNLVDENGKLRPEVKWAIGKSRLGGMQYLPGTQTHAADQAVTRLKNLLTLSLISEMKAQSKTGATGFGALNLKELGVLESGASKLNPQLEEGVFEAEIKRIREKLNRILQPGADETGGAVMTPAHQPVATPKARGVKAIDLMNKYPIGGR